MGFSLTIPNPLLELMGDHPSSFSDELNLDVVISSGVVSEGEAASYALVWEFGNIRQHKKGPKTVLGVSLATGETVWLSTQAPQGWIAVCENRFWALIKAEMQKVNFSGKTAADTRKELVAVTNRIAVLMAEELKVTVPKDTGALMESIQPVEVGSSILRSDDSPSATFTVNVREE